MSIQKKSLISTLQTAKKASVAAENKGEKQVSAMKVGSLKAVGNTHAKGLTHAKSIITAKNLKSLRTASFKVV